MLVMDGPYTCLGYCPNLEPILTPLKRAQPVYFLGQAVENGFGMQRFLQDRHARVSAITSAGKSVSVWMTRERLGQRDTPLGRPPILG